MLIKPLRIIAGISLLVLGAVFFVLPGTMLLLIAGFFLLSFDIPFARKCLNWCQKQLAVSARKVDRFLLNRKLRQY